MRQTRGLGECAAELADAQSSLVVLELTRQNFSGVLRLVSELGRKHPVARAIVLAERGLEDYEWLLREAGAIHFTSSPRELAGLERLVRNHFRRLPVIPTTLAAQVWETLPWSEATSA
jgi:hypothetical protein